MDMVQINLTAVHVPCDVIKVKLSNVAMIDFEIVDIYISFKIEACMSPCIF